MEAKDGRAEALSRLIQAVKDDDERVREAVVKALGEIESAEAVPVLLAALRDKAPPSARPPPGRSARSRTSAPSSR